MSYIMGGSWVKPMISHPVQICDGFGREEQRERPALLSAWRDDPIRMGMCGAPKSGGGAGAGPLQRGKVQVQASSLHLGARCS